MSLIQMEAPYNTAQEIFSSYLEKQNQKTNAASIFAKKQYRPRQRLESWRAPDIFEILRQIGRETGFYFEVPYFDIDKNLICPKN